MLDRKDFTIFKSEDNTIRYEVASFDKDEYDKEDSDKVFYIYAKPKEDDEYYYVIKVKDGIITDEKRIHKEKRRTLRQGLALGAAQFVTTSPLHPTIDIIIMISNREKIHS